jgi:hypothetical protein
MGMLAQSPLMSDGSGLRGQLTAKRPSPSPCLEGFAESISITTVKFWDCGMLFDRICDVQVEVAFKPVTSEQNPGPWTMIGSKRKSFCESTFFPFIPNQMPSFGDPQERIAIHGPPSKSHHDLIGLRSGNLPHTLVCKPGIECKGTVNGIKTMANSALAYQATQLGMIEDAQVF